MAEDGLTDEDRAAIEEEIAGALHPIARRHGIDVSVLVHPPAGRARGEAGDAPRPVTFFFGR
jgi:hypothetical protein